MRGVVDGAADRSPTQNQFSAALGQLVQGGSIMKVISAGSFRQTCPHCHAILEYTRSDVTFGTQIDPEPTILCPECRKQIFVTVSLYPCGEDPYRRF